MSGRSLFGVVALALLLALVATVVTVFAQGAAPSRATLDMVNPGDTFKGSLGRRRRPADGGRRARLRIPGTLRYLCGIHPWMQGVLRVG